MGRVVCTDTPVKEVRREPDRDLPFEFEFCVPGRVQAKERHRFSTLGGAHTYTPRNTADYEALVKAYYRKAGGKYYGNLRLHVTVDAYIAFPKSYSKNKVRELWESGLCPTAKPDCDNILKSILDALNNVAYRDDSAVVSVACRKQYAAPGSEGFVRVVIRLGEMPESGFLMRHPSAVE